LQVLVDLEDLGTVDGLWVLVWNIRSLWDVTGGKVGWDLARVEFVLHGDLDSISGECDTADGSDLWVDTCNTSNHEVGRGQVELLVANKRRDCDSSIDFCGIVSELTSFQMLLTYHSRQW